MANITPRLKLPYLVESQARKEITHNEALNMIDVLLQAVAISMDKNVPPSFPSKNDCYILGALPQNAWEKHPNALAYYAGGSWNFIEPFEGLTVWVKEAKAHYAYDGNQWVSIKTLNHTTGSKSK